MMIRIDLVAEDGTSSESQTFLQDRIRLGEGDGTAWSLPGGGSAALEVSRDDLQLSVTVLSGEWELNHRPVSDTLLVEPGDVLISGDLSLRISLEELPAPESRRTRSALEWMTFGLLTCLGLFQVFLLLGPAQSWRGEVDSEILRPTPTPIPQPTPVPGRETAPTATPAPQPTLVAIPTPEPGTPAPAPTRTPLPRPTPTPLPETLGLSVEELTALARERMAKDMDLAADRILAQALVLDPNSVAAWKLRANLYRKRGLFQDGVEAWQKVMEISGKDSPDGVNANREILVLKNRIRLMEDGPQAPVGFPTPRQVPTPEPLPDMPEEKGSVHVDNMKVARYPGGASADDLRVATFYLKHQAGQPAVPKNRVRVTITFYEEIAGNLRVAEIPKASMTLSISKTMLGGKRYGPLTAAYEVPKGAGKDGRRYYGTVVEVFEGFKRIDRTSDTPVLLDILKKLEKR